MGDEIDLGQYIRTVIRQWRIVVAAALVATGVQVGLSVYSAHGAPKYEAYFWVRPASGTEDLFTNVDGIGLLVTDNSFQRAALAAAGINPDGRPTEFRVTTTPLRALGVLRIGVFGKLSSDTLRRYEEAIAAYLVAEGQKSVDERKRAIAAALNDVAASALKLSAANTEAIGRALPGTAGTSSETLIARALTLGTITSASQGLYTSLFQTEKDLTLRLMDIRPPRLLVAGTGVRSPVPVGRATVAALLGLLIGTALAFFVDRRRAQVRPLPVSRTAAAVDGNGGA